MIRITENFTLRRVAGQLAVSIGPVVETLTASRARDAAEAFGIMACMMEAAGQDAAGEEEELEEVGVTQDELRNALRHAVEAAIREMGIENLKKISWFMSNRK